MIESIETTLFSVTQIVFHSGGVSFYLCHCFVVTDAILISKEWIMQSNFFYYNPLCDSNFVARQNQGNRYRTMDIFNQIEKMNII